jgi:hypothetical protein
MLRKPLVGKRRKQIKKTAEYTVGYVTDYKGKTTNFKNHSKYNENSAP